VKHKEVFKRMRATVDVLSLSATPIPRTLYFASRCTRPERDRDAAGQPPPHPDHRQNLRRADRRRSRAPRAAPGGQVFYLHNRVATIERVAARLRELVPGLASASATADGADELERVMTEFVAGQSQVLVCTTIIESGLDIPNCNTLIIEGRTGSDSRSSTS